LSFRRRRLRRPAFKKAEKGRSDNARLHPAMEAFRQR
jgi:hypothetical protein